MREVDTIIVHCSATPPAMDIGAKQIDKWHKDRGWRGVGYHFVIKRDGTIEKGRDVRDIGAHARGFNTSSIGVCYIGGTDKDGHPEDNRTLAQKTSMRYLIDILLMTFPSSKVLGHRDLPNVAKACPSFDVEKWYYG
jgi:N-acetylmuramoyl-L-alanine amidase